ncbi:MAG: S8 family serine peptidase [Bacteroidetes bacterium]|nr:S8 family serine peptidase [Fibrella sp.]
MNHTLRVLKLAKYSRYIYWVVGVLLSPVLHAQLSISQTNWYVGQPTDSIRVAFGGDSVKLTNKGQVLNRTLFHQRRDTLWLNAALLEQFEGGGKHTDFHVRWSLNGMKVELRGIGQEQSISAPTTTMTLNAILAPGTPAPNWSYLDLASDSVPGVSLYKAYSLLANRISSPVIVGIIDTGLDENHEDLKDALWTNNREIPGDGLDNDRNGYVDDIHGWYWLRFNDGTVLEEDQVEATRIYLKGKEEYDQIDGSRLPPAKKQEWKQYQAAKHEHVSQFYRTRQFMTALIDSSRLANTMSQWREFLPTGILSLSQIQALPDGGDSVLQATRFVLTQLYRPGQSTWSNLTSRLVPNYALYRRIYSTAWQYSYNPHYQPLPSKGTVHLVGSGSPPSNTRSLNHGSLVSGIVGAVRANGKGVDGVADNVRIMNLGAAPANGDERDEYIAKAILYAVDNGASIINISVAKRFSPSKQLVDAALVYAEKRNVLVINCAGNESENTDTSTFYPIEKLGNGRLLTNFMEVGNSSFSWNEQLINRTSNYGATTVDVFAPGTLIRLTAPDNQYMNASGTSFSAPLVAGIAALLKSYFPDLTAPAIKKLLYDSVYRPNFSVLRPGSNQRVHLKELCRSGGIVNAYEAVRLALVEQENKRTQSLKLVK